MYSVYCSMLNTALCYYLSLHLYYLYHKTTSQFYHQGHGFNFFFIDLFIPITCVLLSTLPGHHQQHHHPQHDLHQNLPEVWPVGGQPGQHRVRPGLLHRAAAAAGKHHITALLHNILEEFICILKFSKNSFFHCLLQVI